MKAKLYLLFFFAVFCLQAHAQSNAALGFDTLKMQFRGTKQEQAKYLLRFVQKYAHLGDTLTTVPVFIDSILTDKVPTVSKRRMKKYLAQNQITDEQIGGAIDSGLSKVGDKQASYFVIHDTSNFLAGASSFPNNIDSVSWKGNRLDNKLDFKYTHLFINRLGASITSNQLNKAVRATKFENPAKNPLITKNVVGNFIHIEVIQPRIADPGKNNDAIAISPGFSNLQYKRLALIYIIASLRKGEWLIPTFHAVLDDGIPDGHDDPQNFEITKFDHAISNLYHQIVN